MKRTCKQCGCDFEIFDSEIDFYKQKKLSLPKRCKQCREENKRQRVQQGGDINYQKSDKILEGGKVEVTQRERKLTGNWIYYVVAACLLLMLIPQVIKNFGHNTNTPTDVKVETSAEYQFTFRTTEMLQEHYQKHGVEMGFSSAEEYLEAANKVVKNTEALHKLEAEDGDDVYYLQASNEFVVVSTDGYIRTYFFPNDGIEYYNRQ